MPIDSLTKEQHARIRAGLVDHDEFAGMLAAIGARIGGTTTAEEYAARLRADYPDQAALGAHLRDMCGEYDAPGAEFDPFKLATLQEFDAANYLDSEEEIAAYLEEFSGDDPATREKAVATAARARARLGGSIVARR